MRRPALGVIAASALFAISLLSVAAITHAQTAGGATDAPAPFVPVVPRLELPIPTLPSFSDIQVQGAGGNRSIDVPFIADYIVAIYRYAIGIIVTLAMVMIVIGGLRWTTAAGNATTIGAAKETITRAAIGLMIALGSYAILYAINPELVNFRSIRVDLVSRNADFTEPGEPETFDAPAGPAGPNEPCRSVDSGVPAIDPRTLVHVADTCIDVVQANPALEAPLRDAGRNFCAIRTNPSWMIKGGAYRGGEKSLQLYLRRCYGRVNCTTGTGCPLRQGVLVRDASGVVTTVDPALRGLTGSEPGQPLYEALKPFLISGSRGGHSEGMAVDASCPGRPSTGSFNAPCVLELERAMRSAGWCRIPNEPWHFERPGTPRGDSRCSTGWSQGSYTISIRNPDGSKTPHTFDYSGCAGTWTIDTKNLERNRCSTP